jgi:iron(III) transport system ATP-binding protein
MVYHPRLLLLDEPLSNLDAQLRLRLRDDLRRIVKAAGLTALYVTHDQAEAVVLGDRIGVMRDGRLLQLSTATELYNAPADAFVASFTGASNRIAGQLTHQAAGFATVQATTGLTLRTRLFGTAPTGSPVTVMIRPENVLLGTPEHAVLDATEARGTVLQAHYQGVQTVYTLDMLGTRIEAVEMGTSPRYAEGDAVQVQFPAAQCLTYEDTAR